MKATLKSLLAYLAAVAWLTWPLAVHVTTHLPATRPMKQFDSLYGLWALAHETRALAGEPGASFEGNIFHPAQHALFYGPTALGALPYFAPTFLATGNPALAMNLTFLGALAITAWMLHMVVLRWTGSHLAGAVAGATWLTTPFVLWWWIPTAPYYAILFYLPSIVFLASEPLASVGRCAALALLVAIQSLTELSYVAPAVFAPLLVLAVVRCMRPPTRVEGLRLLAVLGVAVLPLLPLVREYLAVRAANPDLSHQTSWPSSLQSDGPWGMYFARSPFGVPLSVLALIPIGWLASRRSDVRLPSAWRHAALWVFVGVLLACTRVFTVNGLTFTPPQFVLARWAGLQDVIRAPTRLGVAGLMGLCLLAGLAFAACADRLRARWNSRVVPGLLATILLAAMYGEYAFRLPRALGHRSVILHYPVVQPPSPPAKLLQVVASHGGPLLEIPLGQDGVSPIDHARAMYDSIFHGRPVLNGYSSYWPVGFRERMTLAARLPEPAALDALRRETGLALILVRCGYLAQASPQAWLALAEDSRPDIHLLAREGDDLLFELTDAPGPGR